MPAARYVVSIDIGACTACVGLLPQRACMVRRAQLKRAARGVMCRALDCAFIAGVSEAGRELRLRAVIVLRDRDVALTAILEGLGDELRLVLHHEVLLLAVDLRLRLLLASDQVDELNRFRVVLLQIGARCYIHSVLAVLVASFTVRSSLAKSIHVDLVVSVLVISRVTLVLQLGGDVVGAGQLRHFV